MLIIFGWLNYYSLLLKYISNNYVKRKAIRVRLFPFALRVRYFEHFTFLVYKRNFRWFTNATTIFHLSQFRIVFYFRSISIFEQKALRVFFLQFYHNQIFHILANVVFYLNADPSVLFFFFVTVNFELILLLWRRHKQNVLKCNERPYFIQKTRRRRPFRQLISSLLRWWHYFVWPFISPFFC